MLMRRFVVQMTYAVGMILVGDGTVLGQNYPTKPIRMVTAQIGGGADFTARLVAQGLSSAVGRSVVVDNRGLTSMQIVANAPPDGYTLLCYGSPMWIGPLMQDVSWNPVKDFAPITVATKTPNILAVHPSVPAKSVRELIALAKARPGELNYASGSPGATSHLGGELFKSMAGVDIVHIAYKGNGPALTALIAGQVQMMLANVAGVLPHVSAGRLTALAVTSAQPSALAPGLPTVSAAGLPGYELVTTVSLFAPAGTPAPLIKLLNQTLVRVLNSADIKEKFFRTGVEVEPGSPEELMATMKSEIAQFGKVVKDAGLRER